MKWIEVIQVRLSVEEQKKTRARLNKVLKEIQEESDIKLMIYRQFHLDTDIRIHLYHLEELEDKNGSPLGHHLATALKEFGLVNHSLWIEVQK